MGVGGRFSFPFRSYRLFSNIRVIIVLMSITRSYAGRDQDREGWVGAGKGAGLGWGWRKKGGQGRVGQGLERGQQAAWAPSLPHPLSCP